MYRIIFGKFLAGKNEMEGEKDSEKIKSFQRISF